MFSAFLASLLFLVCSGDDQAILNAIASQISTNSGKTCTAPQLSKCGNNILCYFSGDCGARFEVRHANKTLKHLFLNGNALNTFPASLSSLTGLTLL